MPVHTQYSCGCPVYKFKVMFVLGNIKYILETYRYILIYFLLCREHCSLRWADCNISADNRRKRRACSPQPAVGSPFPWVARLCSVCRSSQARTVPFTRSWRVNSPHQLDQQQANPLRDPKKISYINSLICDSINFFHSYEGCGGSQLQAAAAAVFNPGKLGGKGGKTT